MAVFAALPLFIFLLLLAGTVHSEGSQKASFTVSEWPCKQYINSKHTHTNTRVQCVQSDNGSFLVYSERLQGGEGV